MLQDLTCIFAIHTATGLSGYCDCLVSRTSWFRTPDVAQILIQCISYSIPGRRSLSTYKHIHGTVSCAKLFINQLEETILASQNPKFLVCLRFTDHIFRIWIQGQDNLSFLHNLNSSSPICFTQVSSTLVATFLDVNFLLSDTPPVLALTLNPSTTNSSYILTVSIHSTSTKSLYSHGQCICNDENSLAILKVSDRHQAPVLVCNLIFNVISPYTPILPSPLITTNKRVPSLSPNNTLDWRN